MAKKTNNKPQIIAAITASIALTGILTLMFGQAERWVGLGLINQLWLICVTLLFFAIGTFLFAGDNASAEFSGKLFGGKVKVIGPAAFVLVGILVGFKTAPTPQSDFDFTVFLEAQDGTTPLTGKGRIKLNLGDEPNVKAIGNHGEVRFNNIAGRFREQPVRVTLLDGYPYQLAASSRRVTLTGEAVYLTVEAQQATLQGTIETTEGTTIAGATVRVKDQTTNTDENGFFNLTLAADLPETQRLITVDAQGFKSSRMPFSFTGTSLMIQLKRIQEANLEN